MKEGFHSLELNHATWEVPQKYSNLAGIGSGAYGQVNTKHRMLFVNVNLTLQFIACFSIKIKSSVIHPRHKSTEQAR